MPRFALRPWRYADIVASSMPAPHHSHKWLDGVSDALAYGLRGSGIAWTLRSTTPPPPLRPYARAYAYRGLRAFASLSMARSVRDFAGGAVKMFGMNVDSDSWLADKTLVDLERAGPPPSSMVAMIFRGNTVIIPHGAEVIRAGDHLYTVTTKDNLEAFMDFMDFMGIKAQARLRRVFIVGGREVGIEVARALEAPPSWHAPRT